MKKVRIALAQINSVVGDIKSNKEKILDYIQKAHRGKADLVIFPELAITGYPPEDLLFKESFINENLKALQEITQNTKDIVAVVGFVNKEVDIYNSLAVLYNGKVYAVYNKMHLPNYSVFDEVRYFQKGNKTVLLNIDGYKVGVSICEDIWYPENPINALSVEGAQLIVNINASPYSIGKIKYREEMIKVRAKDNLVSIAYVNLVGGQDELVFDGNSFVALPDGKIEVKAKAFEEDLVFADLDLDQIFRVQLKDSRLRFLRANYKRDESVEEVFIDYKIKEKEDLPKEIIVLDTNETENIYNALKLGLRDYIKKNGFEKVVLGLSGGIDSSLVATIAVDALGSENVKGVLMPSKFTSKESIEDAQQLAENLGIETFTLPIEEIFEKYLEILNPVFKGKPWDTTEENLQARIRGNYLMALSNKFGWIVLATGNKSEMSVGYSTLYGDMVGGFAPIKDVYKTTVYKLAEYRNKISPVIPERVLVKPPSAELRENQKDEDDLPPYHILDQILKLYVEEDIPVEEIIQLGFDEKTVKRVARMVDNNEYKRRQAPIGIKITERAFGKDRRMPITNRFRN